MTDRHSLFARKLREFRVSGGGHGRMTQEQLADLIGVSVDAIGKYERSLSFIRGDLEHRLVEVLGWSAAEVTECRQDWAERQGGSTRPRLRLLDEEVLAACFGGNHERATEAMMDMLCAEFDSLPSAFAVDRRPWREINLFYRSQWDAVVAGDRIVASWGLPLLRPEDEALFRLGRFTENQLNVDRLHRPLLPGSYFGYCPALVVQPGYEAAAPLLLTSFIRFLEDLMAREIFLHGIGAISVSPRGAALCQDLGMQYLCAHQQDQTYGVWELPGSAIAQSIFGRRSARVAASYRAAFGPPA